jgi:hypothetical protein
MRFPWSETRERLVELARMGPVRVASDRKSLEALGPDGDPVARLWPPPCLPLGPGEAASWSASVPQRLGLVLVLILRAGAAAAGVWRDDDLLVHKAIKKYVVRGSGKAQTTYRKTKGKSRAGSRLRLRNAQSLLEDVNERLARWEAELGAFDRVLHYAPERLWADLMRADPPPPFAADDPRLLRIALHVHEPRFEELLRVHRLMTQGRLEDLAPGGTDPS